VSTCHFNISGEEERLEYHRARISVGNADAFIFKARGSAGGPRLGEESYFASPYILYVTLSPGFLWGCGPVGNRHTEATFLSNVKQRHLKRILKRSRALFHKSRFTYPHFVCG